MPYHRSKKVLFLPYLSFETKKSFLVGGWWVVGGWKVTLVSVCVHFLKLLDTQTQKWTQSLTTNKSLSWKNRNLLDKPLLTYVKKYSFLKRSKNRIFKKDYLTKLLAFLGIRDTKLHLYWGCIFPRNIILKICIIFLIIQVLRCDSISRLGVRHVLKTKAPLRVQILHWLFKWGGVQEWPTDFLLSKYPLRAKIPKGKFGPKLIFY